MNKPVVRLSLLCLIILTAASLVIIGPPSTAAASFDLTSTPLHNPTLIPAGTSNAVWTPVERDFDGVTMVLVPAGCFMMGSTEEQIDYAFELAVESSGKNAKREWFDDEKPAHEVCLDQPFWIDQTEVTQAQCKQFGGRAGSASYSTGDNLPVEQITWFEARDFCTQRGARLPTEAEWEYAARGPEGLTYPWGNTFVEGNVVYGNNSNNQTANVGSRPGGVSWVGALDMSGNVWEWVADWYGETHYGNSPRSNPEGPANGAYRVVRGGGWYNLEDSLRAAFRFRSTPDFRNNFSGFRCARSYQ